MGLGSQRSPALPQSLGWQVGPSQGDQRRPKAGFKKPETHLPSQKPWIYFLTTVTWKRKTISLWRRNLGCFDRGLGCTHPQCASPSSPPLKASSQPPLALNGTPTTSPAPKNLGWGCSRSKPWVQGTARGWKSHSRGTGGDVGQGRDRLGQCHGELPSAGDAAGAPQCPASCSVPHPAASHAARGNRAAPRSHRGQAPLLGFALSRSPVLLPAAFPS